jgi:peptide/nickel transport system substrate-binding protein
MTRSRRSLLGLLASVSIVVAACGSTATPSPTSAPTAAPPTQPPASETPYDGMVYPTDGSSACDIRGYGGFMGSIKALDAKTIEFDLCYPDAAFLSKIAFSSLGINDSAYLEETGGGGEVLARSPNGTGPFKLNVWTAEQEIVLDRFDGYWGDKPSYSKLIVRWSPEAAQRLVELQSGTVDGIDNPGPQDFTTIQNDPSLAFFPRTALNIFYIGFTNTHPPFDNEKVRQAIAQGIDRKAIVDNFFAAGSSVADYFTPCDIPGGCGGDPWWDFNPTVAKQMLTEAGFDFTKEYPLHLRDVVRSYLPEPVTVATEIQRQLKENLGITVKLDIRDANTYLTESAKGELPGIHLLGWGADYPDVTNFLDAHFGAGASDQFGTKFDDITGPLREGASTADPAKRAALYAQANTAIRTHVPMIPVAHGGSATAYLADVQGAHSSPLGNEALFAMTPGNRDQFVWLQNGEPGSLYCADETDGESLRVCEQIMEPLYAYEIGGTAPEPLLAESCTPNADSTVWTCTLHEGVTFHNGATLDANDVVLSYAVQWDAANPLHKGVETRGLFEYWTYLFTEFLNPPAG